MRERREQYAQNPEEVIKVIQEGTEKARAKAAQTLKEMKDIMGVGLSQFKR